MLVLFPSSDPESPALQAGPNAAPGLLVMPPDHPRREGVERFIHRAYASHYGADVRHFAPLLVAQCNAAGEFVAAAGYRPAGAEPLFLERYLGAPVQTLLGSKAPQQPRRERIVEVGHLAADRPGEGRRLILRLGPHLAAQGFQWVVSTLTEELRLLFVRLGIAPLALGVADPAVLGADAAAWGSYYDHRPVVLAGQIELALQALSRRGVVA